MMSLALYAYVMPYKDMLVNIIELLFQSSLMLLLLLRSTRTVVDTYLVFPYNSGSSGTTCFNKHSIATLTWLLFPFAYFPLAAIVVVIIVKLTGRIW